MNIKSLVPTSLLLILVAAVAYTVGNKGLPDFFAKDMAAKDVVENSEAVISESIAPGSSKQNILSSIQALDESVTDIQIEETPIKGVFWVLLPSSDTLLVTGDGRFVLGRGINEFKDGTLQTVSSSVVETAKQKAKETVVDAFQNTIDQQLVYAAEGEKKAEVYVFTDVNCGYCRKFHHDVPELNKAGIEVHYFAGPFFSKDRESLEEIWCSANPLEAMNQMKSGQKLNGVTVTEACKATVSEHIALGEKLGIRGTPAVYSKNGEQLGGYVPPKELIERLTKG